MDFQRQYPLQLLFVVLLSAAPGFSVAEDSSTGAMEYKIKAAFIYKFCLYVEWPPNAFTAPDAPIVLGIAGPDRLIDELGSIVKDHKINDRLLEVRHISNPTSLKGLHVLFITREEQAHLPQLLALAQGLPLLAVTESSNGLDDGGGINFAVQDNRVRFDVNLDFTGRQGLHLSAQLLKVARVVRGEAGP
jgi:hypothetical protein